MPGWGTGSHMPQLNNQHATAETRHNQNEKKIKEGLWIGALKSEKHLFSFLS